MSPREWVLAELDRLIALAKSATPGPWHSNSNDVRDSTGYALALTFERPGDVSQRRQHRADASFIAAHDPSRMAAVWEWLRAEVERHDDGTVWYGESRSFEPVPCVVCDAEDVRFADACPFVAGLAASFGYETATQTGDGAGTVPPDRSGSSFSSAASPAVAPYTGREREVWLEGYEYALRNAGDEGVRNDAARLGYETGGGEPVCSDQCRHPEHCTARSARVAGRMVPRPGQPADPAVPPSAEAATPDAEGERCGRRYGDFRCQQPAGHGGTTHGIPGFAVWQDDPPAPAPAQGENRG